MNSFNSIDNILISKLGLLAMVCMSLALPVSAQEPIVAWDEEVNGDLSDNAAEPTLIMISMPGEYVFRVSTGPVVPTRLDQPREVNIAGGQNQLWVIADENDDGRLQRSEAAGLPNQRIHFDIYDINGDGELTREEVAQFALTGDGSDIFNFIQAPGINLVGIRVMKYNSGGPENDMTVLAVIDTDESGRAFEAAGVDLVDDETLIDKIVTQDMIVGVVKPESEGGTEIYDEFALWKYYRRNDDTVFWRIGEHQEKAEMELVLTFE